jgi:drug/metabolite transporter (DMT)-like permease
MSESSLPMPVTEPTWSIRIREQIVQPGIGLGIVCGFISAVFYTLSNISLRHSVAADPLLVAAIKAAPTVICLTPFLFVIKLSGRPIATSPHLIPRFILVSLIGQVGGNGSFQVALAKIGLAASVPITLGSLLIGSAIMGRLILGERVQRRTAVAITILIVAVITLSQSGQPASLTGVDAADAVWQRLLGAGCAVLSGMCFAVFSSTMRLVMQRGMQGTTAMWISGIVGSTALFAIVAAMGGLANLSEMPPTLWWSMGSAGVFNFLAFIAITTAMRALPIVAVHLLNASQVAMAATAGVVLFAEPLSGSLMLGILLTICGLLVLARRRSGTRQEFRSPGETKVLTTSATSKPDT